MEKSTNFDQLSYIGSHTFACNDSENIQKEMIIQNPPSLNNSRIDKQIQTSHKFTEKHFDTNKNINVLKNFYVTQNISNNSALNNNDILNDDHKSANNIILQKIATQFMISQIPKNNINKFFEPRFLNSFSRTIIQQNSFSNDTHIVNNQSNHLKPNEKRQENNVSSRHKKFSEEEDNMLRKIVFTFGPKNWRLIASLIPGRTPRQCRDRYSNYLAPGFIHTEWSKEEDKLLAEKYDIYGPKWTQIRQFFPFRTANDIKNRYNYTVCKKVESSKSKKSADKNEMQEQIENSIISENVTNIIEKVQNDTFENEDIIPYNQEMLFLYENDIQYNEFDFF